MQHYALPEVTDETNIVVEKSTARYYQYLENHKQEKEQIKVLLERMERLPMKGLAYYPNKDFTKETYQLHCYNGLVDWNNITYLENMEIILTYDTYTIKYRSKASAYKMALSNRFFSSRIEVNSLTFPVEHLPLSISRDEAYNEICSLSKKEEKTTQYLHNSVLLDTASQELSTKAEKTADIFSQVLNTKDKAELKEALTQIRSGIDKLYHLTEDYQEEVIKQTPALTPEIIKTETENYQKQKLNSF